MVMTKQLMVYCHNCRVVWNIDYDPPKCEDATHVHSIGSSGRDARQANIAHNGNGEKFVRVTTWKKEKKD
jgi:5'(3')-deoxyribonucleotidase